VHSYHNPSGLCDACGTGNTSVCCDRQDFMEPCPAPTCDTSIGYCVRSLGETTGLCEQNQYVSATSFAQNTNSLNFSSSLFGLHNPITVVGDEAWRVSIKY
jgi:hypothetical protein